MNKTKIEWVKNPDGTQGWSWNPIKGLCPVECKLPDGEIYCYGRNNYQRFKRPPQIRMDDGFFNDLLEMDQANKPRGIFVCSTFEIFHPATNNPFPWYPEVTWRDAIFREIENNPRHHFYILTKFPQNIDRPIPDNAWLGVSITHAWDYPRFFSLKRAEAKLKFLGFEPLLYDGDYPLNETISKDINWIIVGRLTGFGKKYDPRKGQIDKFIRFGRFFNIPIFLKDNLKEIWGEPLIQEMPE